MEARSSLVASIIDLASNEKKQAQLRENIGNLGIRNADVAIAKEILQTIK
jgi:UDP-N-acetylglucosamine:LPS N-acetylglucosamine transferase